MPPRGGAHDLRDIITAVLSPRPAQDRIDALVALAYRMAFAYLLQKQRLRRLRPELFGLSLEDLALDCVADLFERDDHLRFVQLQAYFGRIEWCEMDEMDLFITLRRLVFSKLNEGLFRRYREADPNLAKIIRNLKLAAKAEPRVVLVKWQRDLWMVGAGTEWPERAPAAPPEIVEAYLVHHLDGTSLINDAVGLFARFMREHPHYASGYPVTELAQIVRLSYVRLSAPLDDTSDGGAFIRGEVERTIDRAVELIGRKMYPTYVARRRLDEDTFEAHLRAVGAILTAQYVSDGAPVDSHYHALAIYLPHLTEDVYRAEYRNILEYLVKLTRSELLARLRDDPRRGRAGDAPA